MMCVMVKLWIFVDGEKKLNFCFRFVVLVSVVVVRKLLDRFSNVVLVSIVVYNNRIVSNRCG